MSSNTRAELRRAERAARKNPPVALIAAWCKTSDDIEGTYRQLHDLIVSRLGDTRRGPVRWHACTGTEASDRLASIRAASPGVAADDPNLAAHYAKLDDLLATEGGWIITATAQATR